MAEVRMLARSVGESNGRAVVHLVSVADPNDENEATGQATITVNDPDALGDFEEGKVYWLSFSEANTEDAGPHAAALATIREAANIPNSTNTANYKTPPELKVVPPPVPDGVVTEPRPAVIMAPASDAPPPTAGVPSGVSPQHSDTWVAGTPHGNPSHGNPDKPDPKKK